MRHGVLLIDKPAGITSHGVVAKIRKALHEPKIGHGGTLDPAATGLLVLFVGQRALKVIELYADAEKTYEARIRFGRVSTTYDADGMIEDVPARKGWSAPAEAVLLQTLKDRFLGTIRQVPPAHSAVHIDGERAYEVIRRDPTATPDLPERDVRVSDIQLVSYAYPHAMLRMSCSSGTYVRSIAHDLGQVLKCGAYLEGLRRTRVGGWRVEDARKPENVAWAHVIPLKEALANFPRFELLERQWQDVRHGRSVDFAVKKEPLIAWFDGLPVAILEDKRGKAHPRKVF